MIQLEPLITEDEIQRKIAETAAKIDAEYTQRDSKFPTVESHSVYRGQELMIIMVLKGGICIAADLMRKLHIPTTLETVRATSYGQKGTKRGELSVFGLDQIDCRQKHILVVDDIFDSGHTLFQIVQQLREKNPQSLKTLVLLQKKNSAQVDYQPDHVLFHIENHFVVGYGLDYKEYYRGLSGVYKLLGVE